MTIHSEGAAELGAMGPHRIPLMVDFILLSATINLAMGPANAKWALMAPMFMLLGYPPEIAQTAYRVGDSLTNIISPMMRCFAIYAFDRQKLAGQARSHEKSGPAVRARRLSPAPFSVPQLAEEREMNVTCARRNRGIMLP